MIFQGNYPLSLDAKGRMVVPARYREDLLAHAEGQLTFTVNFEGGLLVYPRAAWIQTREQIMALPVKYSSVQRLLLGNAFDLDLDKAGRVLIPPQLRERAGLEKEVVLVGMGKHFDLWSAERYAELQAKDLEQGLPEDLNDFSI